MEQLHIMSQMHNYMNITEEDNNPTIGISLIFSKKNIVDHELIRGPC